MKYLLVLFRDRKVTTFLFGVLFLTNSLNNLWQGAIHISSDAPEVVIADAPSNQEHQGSLSSLNASFHLLEIPSTRTTHSKPALGLSAMSICRAKAERDSYVCEGPDYDRFTNKLDQFVRWIHKQPNKIGKHVPNITRKVLAKYRKTPATWGRRTGSPFPANTTILAVGSSHTRQIFQAMECQYETISYEDMEGRKSNNTMRRGSYYRIEFANHAKLHLVTNNALFYSRHWVSYLEDLIQYKLEDLDAIVFGNINRFIDAMNTTFMELMMEKTSHLKDADFRTVPPPELTDFAQVYPGPIVAHSLMSDWSWGNGHTNLMGHLWGLQQEQPKRVHTIRLVDGRKFVKFLGEECSSDDWQKVGVCSNDTSKHRCIGARGGHPDLLVWEILENLHDLWDHLNDDLNIGPRRRKRRRREVTFSQS